MKINPTNLRKLCESLIMAEILELQKPVRMTAMSKNDTQHLTQTTKTGSPLQKTLFFSLGVPPKNGQNCTHLYAERSAFSYLCEATNTVARSVQHGLGELR